jgi:hypothetical protein
VITAVQSCIIRSGKGYTHSHTQPHNTGHPEHTKLHTCFPACAGLAASAQFEVFVVLLEQRQVPLQEVQDPVCNDRRIRSAWVSIEICYDQSYRLAKLNAAQAQQNARKRFKTNRKTCSRAAPLKNIAATCTNYQQLHAPTQYTATTVWR